jgi:hypothetical protein
VCLLHNWWTPSVVVVVVEIEFVYSVLTGAQAGGSSIPEAVAMETATEEAEVAVKVTGVTKGISPKP